MKQLPQFINLDSCPSCGGKTFAPHITCIDYTYSKLEFTLVKCASCDLVFTNPRPTEEENANYYKSVDYISHTNSTKGIIGFLYKIIRGINLKRKVKLLIKHKSGKQVLDIGCGIGFFPKAANKKGFNTKGVEPDPEALKFALENNKIEVYPLAKLNEFTQEFDTVTMWHVLEHVYHLKEQLAIIKKIIKPGGLFIIAVPNYKGFDGQYYQKNWAGYDVPRHLYHFEEKTVNQLISPLGFELIDVQPMKFDAYYVSMLSEKQKGGSVIKAFFKGLKSNKNGNSNISPYSSQIYVFKNKQ